MSDKLVKRKYVKRLMNAGAKWVVGTGENLDYIDATLSPPHTSTLLTKEDEVKVALLMMLEQDGVLEGIGRRSGIYKDRFYLD